MSLIWIIIEGHAENIIPRKTKGFPLFHVSSMNLHTSAFNGLDTTILSDLNDLLFSTASSLKFQYSQRAILSKDSSLLLMSLQYFSCHRISPGCCFLSISNPNSSKRLTPITSSGSLTRSVSLRGALPRQSEMTGVFLRQYATQSHGEFQHHPHSVSFQNNGVLRFVICLHSDPTHMKLFALQTIASNSFNICIHLP